MRSMSIPARICLALVSFLLAATTSLRADVFTNVPEAADYGLVYTLPEDLRKIYLQFGIDVPKHNGDNSWTLPLPARYIIDRKGIARYAEVSVDYTVRPEPENTIAALKGL